jgi:transposase
MGGDILGLESQRRWGDEGKRKIVLSVGATVPQVAQRHEVTRQQIYAWRHNLKKKGLLSALLEALFLPVEFDRPMVLAMLAVATWAKAGHPAQIELQLGSGRCLRFDHALDRLTLTQLIRSVEGA